jgi:membrane associated rhomboid family serine protease
VKGLLIANFAIFLLQQIFAHINPALSDLFSYYFGLSFGGIIHDHFYWQIFTYMFLHQGWFHIFFNLLTLWMFSGELEQLWGTKAFLRYYFISGIGAGFFSLALSAYLSDAQSVTMGASGALWALLLAFGLIWGNREVLLYFLFPIKMKFVLIFFGLIEFFGTLKSINGVSDNVSHICHVGGIITGFILLKIMSRKSPKSKRGIISGLFVKIRNRKKQRIINDRIKAKDTIDRLMDKIAREGMTSLTTSERRDLEWARRRYYPPESETIH